MNTQPVKEDKEKEVQELLKFREIVESAEDMIYELDEDGKFIYANKAVESFSCLTRTELRQVYWWELIREDARQNLIHYYKNQLKNRISDTYTEFPMVNRKGKEIWIGQNVRMVFEDKWVTRVRAIARDITGRREAEAKLAESQEIFRKAQATAKIGSWEYDIVTDKVVWSEEIFSIYDLPQGEAPSRQQSGSYFPEKSLTQIQQSFDDCIEKQIPFDLKLPFVSAAGKNKWVRVVGAPTVRNEEVVKIAGVFQDVTADRENELQLEHYQNSLKLLNSIASDRNISADEQIENALAVVTEFLQLPFGIFSKIEGNIYHVEHFVTRDGDSSIRKGQQLSLPDMYCDITYRFNDVVAFNNAGNSEYVTHPSYLNYKLETYIGIPVWVNNERYGTVSFSSPEIRKQGFSKNDIEFIRMLSRWIGYTIERQEAQETLLQEKEKAEAASQAKGEFLSVMSHEIRTPLNAVIGMSHLLMQTKPQPHQLTYLKTLRFSAENLLVLVNDILDYSKIEAGKIEFEETDFLLRDLIVGIKESLSVKAEEKGIRLKLLWDDDLPEVVCGDFARLAQILNNLIGNALKFTEKGHVKIIVNLLEEEEHQYQVEFMVEDTGIGISPEKQLLIFDKFSQAESNTTRRFGGTGLGLSITKRLLEMMGSQIMLKSEAGVGSKFYFTLRLKRSNKTAAELNNLLPATFFSESLKGARLLLVEDNQVNQFIALEFLKNWGMEVEVANNGVEAVELAKARIYDLILMDLQMPEMDGYEASRTIKALESPSGKAPIIALTASAQLDSKDKVYKSGMVDFVAKPFNPNELRAKLHKHLGAAEK
ncbi:ATP-binding protein [Nafulsella turpanensis]|uniref:ATP-binding protein n=1 Tax=Nafulsella turpanensis TaxID=1265690 RepID=UPI000349A167|nr:ATP-binding protein [Nafulsella turpanensis]